jgi:hypothetical protein
MPSKPKGIIDDLFVPISRSAANEVRNAVRAAIAAEKRVAVRKVAAKKTKDKLAVNVAKQVEIGSAQVKRATKKGVKPDKALIAKRMPLAESRVINAKNTQLRTSQTAIKADRAERHFADKFKTARGHFPDERSFSKAWREEKSSMRTGIPVPNAGRVSKPTKKITKKATAKAKPKSKGKK